MQIAFYSLMTPLTVEACCLPCKSFSLSNSCCSGVKNPRDSRNVIKASTYWSGWWWKWLTCGVRSQHLWLTATPFFCHLSITPSMISATPMGSMREYRKRDGRSRLLLWNAFDDCKQYILLFLFWKFVTP